MTKTTVTVWEVWQSLAAVSGALLVVPGCGAVAAAACALFHRGPTAGSGHLAVFGVGLIVTAGVLWKFTPRSLTNVLAVNSAAVAISWMFATVVCAIPFLSIAHQTSAPNETLAEFRAPLNAWYESVSSLSSSGLSVASKSSDLPAELQIWRSICQWIGGVGLAVFALLLLDSADRGQSIYQSETRDWQPHATPNRTVVTLLLLYATLTILCLGSYWLLGMPAWEAVNHSLITVSTGGLTITNDSFTGYSAGLKTAAGIFMWLGAVSFGGLYMLATGNLRDLWQSTALRALVVWTAILFSAFGFGAWLRISEEGGDSIFNVASAISTCGVSSGNLAEFSVTSIWLLMVAMFIGGCGDSTAGGIKVNRAVWMLKTSLWQIRKNLGAGNENLTVWDGEEIDPQVAAQRSSRTLVLLFVFLATLALGFLGLRVIYVDSVSSDRVFFQATSALGAVGLSMDLTGPDRPAAAKVIEIVLMIAGRLEILAVLLVPAVLLGKVRRDTQREFQSEGAD